jgi:hypothetical protein
MEGITYKIYYKKRSYFSGDQMDSVDMYLFYGGNNEGSFPIYFKTRGNRIISDPIIYGGVPKMLSAFDFFPNEVLVEYFGGKAKKFLEKYLPIEYPYNGRSN